MAKYLSTFFLIPLWKWWFTRGGCISDAHSVSQAPSVTGDIMVKERHIACSLEVLPSCSRERWDWVVLKWPLWDPWGWCLIWTLQGLVFRDHFLRRPPPPQAKVWGRRGWRCEGHCFSNFGLQRNHHRGPGSLEVIGPEPWALVFYQAPQCCCCC